MSTTAFYYILGMGGEINKQKGKICTVCPQGAYIWQGKYGIYYWTKQVSNYMLQTRKDKSFHGDVSI